ncbi:hypothetical protein BH09BAC6_BH09BAC6_19230 [soil metagenome]
MQLTIKFILLPLIIACALGAHAQTCTGSLGDPVINETFGSGGNYGLGPALPDGVTTLNYIFNSCGGDENTYTLALTLSPICKGGTWLGVDQDHTGNKNGYMMVINASAEPSVFFVEKADGSKLCPNATYEFAAWIMNLVKKMPETDSYAVPNITFSIETVGGKVLKTYNTGNIPNAEGVDWHQYGTFFTSPADGSDIIVKMTNNSPGGFGNDFILDDITFKPCGPVVQVGFGSVNETTAQQICEGTNASFVLKAAQTGYANPNYQWQIDKGDGKGWANIPGETTTTLNRTFTNAVPGQLQYRIGVLSGTGASLNCRIYSQPLSIIVNPTPYNKLEAVTNVCSGNRLTLNLSAYGTFHWTGPNNFTSDEQAPVVSSSAGPDVAGVYTVTISDRGCSTTASTLVKYLPNVKPVISNNVTICEGDKTQVVAGGGLYYKWKPAAGLDRDDIADPIANPAAATTYSVLISSDGCAADVKEVTVSVIKRPVANAGPGKTIMEGEAVKLDGKALGDNISFYWTPADLLDNPNSITPLASPVENSTYTLHVVSNDNCGESTSSVVVRVHKKVTIPNAFSPNSDGVNDYWDIKNLTTYPKSVLTVYTRYGKQVYKSTGYSRPWNGIYNNAQLPAGTYYYVINFNEDVPTVAGWVLIVR